MWKTLKFELCQTENINVGLQIDSDDLFHWARGRLRKERTT